ncbi:MAG: methylated-DNA--[protein]-cysteine S-methyltransferase [Nocardioidaceae bacterium]
MKALQQQGRVGTGRGDRRIHCVIDSPLGLLTLVATGGALSSVYMHDHVRMPDLATFGPRVKHGFEHVTEQLADYFTGSRRTFDLTTHVVGSDFQRTVWRALTQIPYGQTWSYAALADAVGRPDRVRAVAAANGRNPLSIVIPCHRVVGSDGSLIGHAGGLARKRMLLDLEARRAVQEPLFP